MHRVQNLNKLDDLNYRSILGMADLNIGFATRMNTKLFAPILGIGKKYQAIIEMMEFENDRRWRFALRKGCNVFWTYFGAGA